jgi:phage major head subunit gpT-like protein
MGTTAKEGLLMSLNTAAALAKLRSLTAKFDAGIEAARPFYPEVCTVVPSDGADEEYGWIDGIPAMSEWLGDRIFHSLRGANFTLANKTWENSVEIDRDRIEDDRLGMYGPVLEQLGMEAEHHPDSLLITLMKGAESAACFDGQYFFDTDHSWGDSGSQSNDLTATAATGTAPTEAEFRTAYHAARAALLGFKRPNGELFIRPTVRPLPNLLLVVPTAMEEVANQAINKQLVSSGETNIVLDKPTIMSIDSTTWGSTAKFDLYDLGRVLKPYVFQRRRPLSRQMKGLTDREFKNVKFMADARYNVGYLAWWTAVRTTFT